MRDLSATKLEAAQQAMTIDALAKIHLTDGVDIYTYTRDRILDISYPQEPWSQTSKVLLDNGDGALTDLDLKGFYGFISTGAITPAGEEYSDGPLLWVIAQRFDSSEGGEHQLTCELSLIGIPNWLALDKASRNYIPDEDDTKTIETLFTEIMGATLGCFSHCRAWEVVVDSRDDLINTYMPKDSLRIYKGNSRLAVAKVLLASTECVMLAKADGKIHLLKPQITGTPVYTYSLETGHTFFSKAYRQALVIPNYIYCSSPPPTVPNWVIVQSTPYEGEAKDQADIDKFGERKHTVDYGAGTFESDEECATEAQILLDEYIALHDPYYEGTATDPDSIAALATDGFNGEIREHFEARFEDDDQAEDMAIARLAKHKLNAEMGAASVPLNVGAEVYDYIRVTDKREGGSVREGTTGSLTLHYNADEAEWRMSFSLGQRPKAVDVMAAIEEDAPYFGRLIVDNLYAKNILAESLDMVWIDPDGTIDLSKIGDTLDNLADGENYARVKTLHLDAGQIKLDEHIFYSLGYDPNTKRRNFTSEPTTPYDLGDMWTDGSVLKRCTTARATGDYVAGDWTQITIDEISDGAVDGYQRVKSASLTAGGLVVLDQVDIEVGDEHYGLLKQTEIEAGHIKLSTAYGTTDDLDEGDSNLFDINHDIDHFAGKGLDDLDGETTTYQRVKATEIDAGRIQLTSANYFLGKYSGKWYEDIVENAGVTIEAGVGINIWGRNNALTTRATEEGAIQCYVGSDGKLYAGAGAVVLDAQGIKIIGQALKFFYNSDQHFIFAASLGLWIQADSGKDLHLNPLSGTIQFHQNAIPTGAYTLGNDAYKWQEMHAKKVYATLEMYVPAVP